MRNRHMILSGVTLLACAMLVGCVAEADAPTSTSSPSPSSTPSESLSSSPAATPLPTDQRDAVIRQMVHCPGGMDFQQGVFTISAIENPNNPNEAELSQAIGQPVKLELYPGPKDPDLQHPWVEYDQAITADGMHFATMKCAEVKIGNDMGMDGTVVNVDGCLTLDGKRVPVFGGWKSVAPSLRAGDKITGGNGGSVALDSPDEDVTIPGTCQATGITDYFYVTEVESVN